MEITECQTGIKKVVVVRNVENEDLKLLTRKRYSFSWKLFRKTTTIYKLLLNGNDDILGVIGLIDWPGDKRTEIKLLSSSRENIGKNKKYEGIGGCLIAIACRMAVQRYGAEACVSLVPKTELIDHYINKYYMKYAGRQLFIDGKELIRLLKEYSL